MVWVVCLFRVFFWKLKLRVECREMGRMGGGGFNGLCFID